MTERKSIILPGEAVGNYDKDWKTTFYLQFLLGWFILFLILLATTIIFDSTLFSEKQFFAHSLVKLAIMILTALFGGLVCRHY